MTIGTPRTFGGGGFGTGTTTATTASDTPTSGDRIVVYAVNRNGSAFQSDATISNTGTALTWTKFVTGIRGPAVNPFYNVCAYWADATPNAGTAITISLAGSQTTGIAILVPMGADPDTSNVGTATSGASGTLSPSITGTPAAALSFLVCNGGGTVSQSSGYTSLYNAAPFGKHAAFYDLTSPAATINWTTPGVNTVAILLELKEASGGTNYTMPADVGSYTLTGQAVATLYKSAIAAAVGAHTLAGQAVALVYTGYELFNDASLALPNLWTSRWVTANISWSETASGYLRSTTTATGRHLISYDQCPLDADVEILVKWRAINRNINQATTAFAVRGTGSAGAENGYRYQMAVDGAGAGNTNLSKLAAGTSTVPAFGTAAWNLNTWYWARMRISGSASTR